MANTTCKNCGVTLNSNASPIEDPEFSGTLGSAQRFCSGPCRDLWRKRNEAKGPSTVLQGMEG